MDARSIRFIFLLMITCWLPISCRPSQSRPIQPSGGQASPQPSIRATIPRTSTPASGQAPTTVRIPSPPPTSPAPTIAAPTLETDDLPQEQPVTTIPLTGAITKLNAEISGMGWYSDTLVLLPQYPSEFGNSVFALEKSEILDFLDGKTSGPLDPREIRLVAPGLEANISGFEGFEAIAFKGNQVFLTVESSPGDQMMGYLISGAISPDLSEIRLNTGSLTRIPPQVDLSNMSYEALIPFGRRLITLFEANGQNVNPSPLAHTFDQALQPAGDLSFPNIEYRITDATPADENGRFWAVNFFFIGDLLLKPADDPLAAEYGRGPTHSASITVERLVEFQFGHDGITFSDTPPVQLQLLGDDRPRNWEAIALLEDRGFLLATDTFPETIFGFVPFPEE